MPSTPTPDVSTLVSSLTKDLDDVRIMRNAVTTIVERLDAIERRIEGRIEAIHLDALIVLDGHVEAFHPPVVDLHAQSCALPADHSGRCLPREAIDR